MNNQLFFLDSNILSEVSDVCTICEYRSVMLKFNEVIKFDNGDNVSFRVVIGDDATGTTIRGDKFEVSNKLDKLVNTYIIEKMKKLIFSNFSNKIAFTNDNNDGFDLELLGDRHNIRIRVDSDEIIVDNPQVRIKYQVYDTVSVNNLFTVLHLLLNGEVQYENKIR